MKDTLSAVLQRLENGRPVVKAVVMASSGSVPRTAGALMAVFDDGAIAGTVGGGAVEAAAIQAGAGVLRRRQSRVEHFDLSGGQAADLGMICGGRVSLLLDYLEADAANICLIKDLISTLEQGGRRLVVSDIAADGRVLGRGRLLAMEPGGAEPGFAPLGQLAGRAEAERAPFVVEQEGLSHLVEPVFAPYVLHIVGAGHVAKATAALAAFVGFRVLVYDDRAEFANPENFPAADRCLVVPDYGPGLLPRLGPKDYVVIVTRGHLHDQEALARALETGAGYLGMIGSRRKRDAIYANLLKMGYSQEAIAKVHSPIGLKIGADTPNEIAVSIMAEIIAHRAGKLP